ncbi:MAG TPA: Uma2 family endonuclease [Candidatus Obscuribacterales bacterium]
MVQTPTKTVTLEQFLQQPETKPACEYIDGQVIQKPMPQGQHSTIQGELVAAINAITKPSRTAWAFPELRCTFGGRSIIPDIAVFQWERLPTHEDGTIANAFNAQPDWTIEILSPDQSVTRVTSNILHCLEQGCQLGWLIDPAERLVQVYDAGNRLTSLEVATDGLLVPEFAQPFALTVGQLFGWLQVR